MQHGALRLFLALVVVAHHSTPLRLGAWAVALFFVISGYWIAKKLEVDGAGGEMRAWGRFWMSRWWRLVPLFLVCSGIAWGIGAVSGASGPPWDDPLLWWGRQVPVVGSAWAGRVIPVTWTLDVEMQFYLAAPFLAWGIGRVSASGLAVAGMLALGWAGWLAFRGLPADASRLDAHLGWFLVGWWLAGRSRVPGVGWAWTGMGGAGIASGMLLMFPETRGLLWRAGSDAAVGWATVPGLPGVVAGAGCLLLLPYLARNLRQPSSELDRWLGQLAYPLFLFHWIPRDLYYRVVDWNAPLAQNLGWWVAQVAAAGIGAVALWWLVDRPSERLRRALSP